MSSGLSVALPLTISETFGVYNLNTGFMQLAKQNLKMLVLTNPGERIMDPHFGVGINRMTFELAKTSTYRQLTARIKTQTKEYLPYIVIDNVDYQVPENNPDLFPYDLSVAISFTIPSLGASTMLQVNVNHN